MGLEALIPTAISLASSIFGKKKAPEAAPYVPVNLQQTQTRANAGNQAAEGSIEDLLTRANSYTQGQATDLMEKAVPGYANFAKTLLASGENKLQHPYDLPQDVIDNLTRISAERGVQRGTQGQFNQYSGLRDLGLNMLDYGNQNFNQALSALTTVTGTAPRVSPMSPLSFYVTPQQQAQNQQYTNTQQQRIQQDANDATTAAKNFNTQNLWDSLSSAAGSTDWSKLFSPTGGKANNAIPGYAGTMGSFG